MHIYDSAAKTKRKFIEQNKGIVYLYVCGPTVYDDAHLGHAKSALTFDLLSRVLKAHNLHVVYARNITDIDDKIIQKAKQIGISIQELTDKFTTKYHKDMAHLGITPPDIEPKATQSVDAMTDMIGRLLDSGHAYKVRNGDIYFDTSSDKKYLSISHKIQDDSDKQNRIISSDEKKHDADFALWKHANKDEVGFDSIFGRGRPGWHLECSAMIEKHLVKDDAQKYAVDIHGGGADLLFPHHENEAAQTRCSTSHEIAAYWMHNGFVNINNQKMSKSLGNSFFIKDALKLYNGEVLRFYLLSTHYRSNFNFTEDDLLASKKRLDKIYRLKQRLFGLQENTMQTDFQIQLLKALSDDLNISLSMALIDEMISNVNDVMDSDKKNKQIKKEAVSNLTYIKTILGFGFQDPFEYFQAGAPKKIKEQILALITQREQAKKQKDYQNADKIREQIIALGANIMDTPKGTLWEYHG